MKSHEFSLVLKSVHEETASLEDSIFECGCDDALIHFRNGGVYLEFNREAVTLEEAVISAIKNVKSASLIIEVASVSPANWVSEAEIAKRANVSRQLVSLWIKGQRRKYFPSPAIKISEKSFLWDWSQVAEWLYENKIIKNKSIVINALFIKNMNAVLEEQDQNTQRIRHDLLARISVR